MLWPPFHHLFGCFYSCEKKSHFPCSVFWISSLPGNLNNEWETQSNLISLHSFIHNKRLCWGFPLIHSSILLGFLFSFQLIILLLLYNTFTFSSLPLFIAYPFINSLIQTHVPPFLLHSFIHSSIKSCIPARGDKLHNPAWCLPLQQNVTGHSHFRSCAFSHCDLSFLMCLVCLMSVDPACRCFTVAAVLSARLAAVLVLFTEKSESELEGSSLFFFISRNPAE